MTIVRGTTATIEYTFKTVNPTEMVAAYMSVKQLGNVVIERDLTTAAIDDGKLSWTLTQEESLRLNYKAQAVIYLDYIFSNGTRGAGKTINADIEKAGKDEVI